MYAISLSRKPSPAPALPEDGPDLSALLLRAERGETLRVGSSSAPAGGLLEATDEDMRAINSEALAPLTKDDVIVFERYVITDQPSRSIGLVFSKGALEKMATDFAAGRTRLLYHDTWKPVGATIGAEVVTATVRGVKGKWVKTREYVLKAAVDEGTLALITGGVLRYDSVGLALGSSVRYVEQEVEGKRLSRIEVDYVEGQERVLEAREVSFVYLGEMPGAGSDKGRGKKQLAAEGSFGIDALHLAGATTTATRRAWTISL